MKWRQFLGAKQVLNVELAEWLRPMMADWLEKSEEKQHT
jgi:predicted alpha/beta hydrolase family esterase